MDLLVDPLLSESISNLTKMVAFAVTTTANFKPELDQLQRTLQTIAPIINDVVKLNRILARPKQQSDMFIDEIQKAEKLVEKCWKIKWDLLKQFTHSLKLKHVNNQLLAFFQLEVQADQSRDIKQALVELNDVIRKMGGLSTDVSQVGVGVDDVNLKLEGLSMDVKQIYQIVLKREQFGYYSSTERAKFGWRVPILPAGIVAFDEPLKKLKVKVLDDDESSVVVVAAAGGCGKTTLVIMLCHDAEIQNKFGENIFFVTVSEKPNFMVVVNDLFNPNSLGQTIPFQSDEDAKHKLGNFLLEKVSRPMLLVVDDVWDESFIDYFPLQINGCKILVTSREKFRKYDVFEFDHLSDEDAKILFRRLAFSECNKRPTITIDENIVNQIMKRCKNHPLTLTVVGGSLNGRDESAWKSMQRTLSRDTLVLDLNEQVRKSLERSFTTLGNDLKECYMDFGLFPEDQRIPASTLLDMWVHLYNHADEGYDTFDKIVGLSLRNLVNLEPTRTDSGATVNYCNRQFVTQHDLLRELAIHLSSRPEVPIAQRKRLIITACGEHLPASILKVQEPMQACILSISTGNLFSLRWGDMKVPEVEVMVLNLKSKTYTLPNFMKEMQKLKVLNVTNYGLHPTYIENFHIIGCLSNLSRIRLERVTVSPLSTSILALEKLQKASFIMCKIGSAFETELSSNNLNVWPSLVELEMDYCHDLLRFPGLLCGCIHLKTLSITNCNETREISEEFGKLTNLEYISFRSCTKLKKLPESITILQKLSILDISDCVSLSALPTEMGKLGGLRTIHMKGCMGINELPSSIEELSNTNVFYSEDIYHQWCEYENVETNLVEEVTSMEPQGGPRGPLTLWPPAMMGDGGDRRWKLQNTVSLNFYMSRSKRTKKKKD